MCQEVSKHMGHDLRMMREIQGKNALLKSAFSKVMYAYLRPGTFTDRKARQTDSNDPVGPSTEVEVIGRTQKSGPARQGTIFQ